MLAKTMSMLALLYISDMLNTTRLGDYAYIPANHALDALKLIDNDQQI